jgi:hypothetical protein
MLGVNIPALSASLRRTNQRIILSRLLRLGAAPLKCPTVLTAGLSATN